MYALAASTSGCSSRAINGSKPRFPFLEAGALLFQGTLIVLPRYSVKQLSMRLLTLFSFLLILTSCGQPSDSEDIGERQDEDNLAEELAAPTPPIDEVLDDVEADENGLPVLKLNPVYHGSLVIEYNDQTIYVDPHGGADRYAGFANPDLVLITHTHGDHMDLETLQGLNLEAAAVTGPQSVINALPGKTFAAYNAVANGEATAFGALEIEVVPAYNPPSSGKTFHPQGKFNGYILTFGDQRVYVAGDTGLIPEMKDFENVDYAFVPMNQPYTMTVEEAAQAIADIKPAVVYPYHYRNQGGTFSDLDKFETIVNEQAPDTEVRRVDWYQKAK